jgi:hypothetical protein
MEYRNLDPDYVTSIQICNTGNKKKFYEQRSTEDHGEIHPFNFYIETFIFTVVESELNVGNTRVLSLNYNLFGSGSEFSDSSKNYYAYK